MGRTLTEIARQLKNTPKKVQLIYAFNGVGKTRLSREFKQLIAPQNGNGDDTEQSELARTKILFNFLRNILEKTSTFLGYKRWQDLLPQTDDGRPNPYEARMINLFSHSKHAGDEVAALDDDKRVLRYLVNEINTKYRFQQTES